MGIFKREQYIVLPSPQKKDRIPDGLWYKCDKCLNILYVKDFEENLKVCPKCNYHTKIDSKERLSLMADSNSFEELFTEIEPTDPLEFVDSKKYKDRLKTYQRKSALKDAIVTGTAKIEGMEVTLGLMDFNFIGGSMGSVVGEKVTRLFEHALDRKLPVVIVCTSGGARMQEGILSLMQMAKTSIAVAKLSEANLPYISVLTDPTTAGVMASFASLGDVIIAEPGALIGFAGPRVIQQTINQILPKDFQTAEFVREHGFIDVVVHRKEIKKTVSLFLSYFCSPRNPSFKNRASTRSHTPPESVIEKIDIIQNP